MLVIGNLYCTLHPMHVEKNLTNNLLTWCENGTYFIYLGHEVFKTEADVFVKYKFLSMTGNICMLSANQIYSLHLSNMAE